MNDNSSKQNDPEQSEEKAKQGNQTGSGESDANKESSTKSPDDFTDNSEFYDSPYAEKNPGYEKREKATDSNYSRSEQEIKESAQKPKSMDKEKKMPFLDHLEELRWTILRSMIAITIAAIVCYIFSQQIVDLLRSFGPADLKLIYLSPTEGFMIYIKVSLFAGIVVALPYVTYEFWKFVVPGLLEKEKRLVPPIVFFTVLCFIVGATFAATIIIPFSLKFLLSYQREYLEATITIGKYLGFVVTILLVFGVVFELPVLAFFLTKVGILTPEFLTSKRRYGIVIIFIVAAILTPPDVFTQLLLAGPLIVLYEISIWVSRMVRKKQKAAEQSGE